MTLRNIGIVFSPTLGIPAGIFSELVSHFGAIFDAEPEEPEPQAGPEAGDTQRRSQATGSGTGLEIPADMVDDTVKRKRNSMLYQAAGADAMLGIGGRSLDPSTSNTWFHCSGQMVIPANPTVLDDSASEVSTTDFESEIHSAPSSDHADSPYPDSGSPTTPKADRYPSASAVRRAKAAGAGAGAGSGAGGAMTSYPQGGGSEGYGGQVDGGFVGQGQRGMPASPRPEARV